MVLAAVHRRRIPDRSLVSPSYATSLVGLPPAIVVTAEFDILRDEGAAYAERLAQAGVPTVTLHYPGAIHGFFWMAAAVDDCSQMLTDVRDHLHHLWEHHVIRQHSRNVVDADALTGRRRPVPMRPASTPYTATIAGCGS